MGGVFPARPLPGASPGTLPYQPRPGRRPGHLIFGPPKAAKVLRSAISTLAQNCISSAASSSGGAQVSLHPRRSDRLTQSPRSIQR